MINFLIKFVALILCIVAIAGGAYLTYKKSDIGALQRDFEEVMSTPMWPEGAGEKTPSTSGTPGVE